MANPDITKLLASSVLVKVLYSTAFVVWLYFLLHSNKQMYIMAVKLPNNSMLV